MKKILFILSLVLVVGLTATIGYAQISKPITRTDANYEQWDDWHKERMEWKKAQLNKAVENKEITEEEAKDWKEHFDYMEKFHREHGPIYGEGCCGRSSRNGYGSGMMRGYRWNR